MKKFLSLLAVGSVAMSFGASAFADDSVSSMSASSSSQWSFTTTRGSGTRCEDLSGMAKFRCTSGMMKHALQHIKREMSADDRGMMKHEDKMMNKMGSKMMKNESKMMKMMQKFKARNIKEMERERQSKNLWRLNSSSPASSAASSTSAASSSTSSQ